MSEEQNEKMENAPESMQSMTPPQSDSAAESNDSKKTDKQKSNR